MAHRTVDRASGRPGVVYWAVAVGLIVFGVVGVFSVGLPFLALGLALVAVAPSRHRAEVLWPVVAGVLGFFAAAILVMPWGCTRTASAVEAASPPEHVALAEPPPGNWADVTRCSNPLGIAYSGGPGYAPSYVPALTAGLVVGAGAGALVRRAVRARQEVTS